MYNGPALNALRDNVPAHLEATNRRPRSVLSVCDASDVEVEYQQRSTRRTVPLHQWKLALSGDGHGIHLYDFLSEIQMLKRAEGISDEELLSSIVHLLAGRARLWYRSWYDTRLEVGTRCCRL